MDDDTHEGCILDSYRVSSTSRPMILKAFAPYTDDPSNNILKLFRLSTPIATVDGLIDNEVAISQFIQGG